MLLWMLAAKAQDHQKEDDMIDPVISLHHIGHPRAGSHQTGTEVPIHLTGGNRQGTVRLTTESHPLRHYHHHTENCHQVLVTANIPQITRPLLSILLPWMTLLWNWLENVNDRDGNVSVTATASPRTTITIITGIIIITATATITLPAAPSQKTKSQEE